MSFLAPALLFGALGISLPILAHLLSRHKVQRTPWAAMQFLDRSVRVRSRQIRLRDLLLLCLRCLAVLFLVAAFGVVEDAEDFADNTWMLHVLLLAIGAYLLLNGWLLWRRGQTIGKWALGIAIADANSSGGKAPLWKLIFMRAWFFPLLFGAVYLPVGVLVLIDHLFIFTRRRRCLHDLFCGTVVVNSRHLIQPE